MPRKTALQTAIPPIPKVVGFRKVRPKDEWGGYVQCSVDGPDKESFDLCCLKTLPQCQLCLLIASQADSSFPRLGRCK